MQVFHLLCIREAAELLESNGRERLIYPVRIPCDCSLAIVFSMAAVMPFRMADLSFSGSWFFVHLKMRPVDRPGSFFISRLALFPAFALKNRNSQISS
jgi:hypothetical protein